MKKFILFLVVSLIGYTTQAQSRVEKVASEKKHLVEIEDGLFKVMIRCDQGKLRQVGFYKEHINGELVKHGVWKMFDTHGEVLTTAKFEVNKMVWIKPKGERKYTSEEIKDRRQLSMN